MKRFFVSLVVVLCFVVSGFAENNIPSVSIKVEPIFDGIGFSIKGNAGEEYVVTEFHLAKLVQVNLKDQSSVGEKAFKGILIFKGEKFPVKVISPDFKHFEADIMDPKSIGRENGVVLPLGHLTFKVVKPDPQHSVAAGKLMIKIDGEESSGDYVLLLNEKPQPPAGQKDAPKEPKESK